MFYQQFFKVLALKQALQHKLMRQSSQENTGIKVENTGAELENKEKSASSPIKIQEIVVIPTKQEYGEGPPPPNSKVKKKDVHNKESEAPLPQTIKTDDMLTRLKTQIQLLAGIANLQHEKNNCERQADGSFTLQKAALNTITRLSTVEFSYYGERPLTLEEFGELVEEISRVGTTCYENVHVLFSSFAVVDESSKILNMAVYLQGGSDAKVDVITKTIAFDDDVRYEGYDNFSKQRSTNPEKFKSTEFAAGTDKVFSAGQVTLIMDIKLKDDVTAEVSMMRRQGQQLRTSTITNNSLLELTTAGGKKFLLAIEICYDHFLAHAKKILHKQLLSSENTSRLFPASVDHLVTSNSVDLDWNYMIADIAVHADPGIITKGSNMSEHSNAGKLLDKRNSLTAAELNSRFTAVKFDGVDGNLSLNNPPFGPDLYVLTYNERQLGGYISVFGKGITASFFKANQAVMDQKVATILQVNGVAYNEEEREQFLAINRQKAQQARDILKKEMNKLHYSCIDNRQPNPVRKNLITTLRTYSASLEKYLQEAELENDFLSWVQQWSSALAEEVKCCEPSNTRMFTQSLLHAISEFQRKIEEDLTTPLIP